MGEMWVNKGRNVKIKRECVQVLEIIAVDLNPHRPFYLFKSFCSSGD